ncbi:MAG: putative sugar nucleotidyl transferase [Gemmatimonadota bacterium]
MKLFVFDDRIADGWAPFSLTRPCSELLLGTYLLRERIERWAGIACSGLVTRPWLESFTEQGAPPVVPTSRLPEHETAIFVCSRAVVTGGSIPAGDRPANLWIGETLVGSSVPAGAPRPAAGWFTDPGPLSGAEDVPLEGDVLCEPWDFVSSNPDRLLADLSAPEVEGIGDPSVAPAEAGDLPRGVELLGRGALLLGDGVTLEPGVLLDTRRGPIRLDSKVEVRAGSRLEGPLYAGPGSRLLGGPISVVAAGPRCTLRGEIQRSVVLGYSNKAHAGFLGHAYLGRWVNLGAMTTNSDLKNNYRPVRMGPPGAERDTGLLKLGCLLGDHVRTGIGLLLNTGTVVGAGSNLFGTEMPPNWVEPFSWGSGRELVEYRKDAFLATAQTVLERRGVAFDPPTRRWLAAVWDAGRTSAGGRLA